MQEHGGKICNNEFKANTVIVHDRGLEELRDRYKFIKNRYAESPDFIKKCIGRGQYVHDYQVQARPLGGRIPGS